MDAVSKADANELVGISPRDPMSLQPLSRAPGAAENVGVGSVQNTKSQHDMATPVYRLYKRRFAGVAGIMVLNAIGGMNWPWFGPIANDSAYLCDFWTRQYSS